MARIRNIENTKIMQLKFRKAFTKLLKTYSWEDITIKDICKEAKVSPGLFYYYYDSKEAVMRDKYEAFDEALSQTVLAMAKDSDLYESMFLYVRVYIAKCYEKGANYISQMIKFYLDDSKNDKTWQTNRGFFNVLIELINRAKTAGEIPDTISSPEMAHIFTAALRGQSLEWCADPDSFDLTGSARSLIRFFYLGWKQIDHEIFKSVLEPALISPS